MSKQVDLPSQVQVRTECIINLKQLLRGLSKVVDDADGGALLHRIFNGIDIDGALVCQMMEHVQ